MYYCTAGTLLLISPSGFSTTTRLSVSPTPSSPFSVRSAEENLSPLELISLIDREKRPTLPEELTPLLSRRIPHF